MASHQTKQNIPKAGRQRSTPEDERTRPRGVQKGKQLSTKKQQQAQLPPRKSTRIQHTQERFRSPSSDTPCKEGGPAKDRKRKRSQQDETARPPKQPRTSPTIEETTGKTNPLEYWTQEFRWPNEFFKPGCNMNHLLARRKSSSSVRSQQSEARSTAPGDKRVREAQITLYSRPSYTTVLATKGSFMDKSDLGITDASKRLCRTLLETKHTVPQDTLFRDDIFEDACRKLQDKNEARVVQDIARLIVPSAETLATYGATHLKCLVEGVNEGWNSARPFYGPRPQPDYSLGFGRSTFTADQLEKLVPFVGEVTDACTSYFMATWQMYLPFLTCEVKCAAAALDTADRQNAHSMTIAVRGIVELFRLVNREKELHREILAFSFSHDHRIVRIYGHYPIIEGNLTTYYRHPIRTYDFTEMDGKEKWTAWTFTNNVLNIFMPAHVKRICSVIDALPLNLEILEKSDRGESGLSQGLDSHNISDQSSYDAALMLEGTESQSSHTGSRDDSPTTSMSPRHGENEPKQQRKRHRPAELYKS